MGDERAAGEFLAEMRAHGRTLTLERFEARFPWTFLAIATVESNLTIQYTTRRQSLGALVTDGILDLMPMVKTATAYSGLTSLLVGRSRACDLWINDASISKTHGRFTLSRGLPQTLEDLGSRNGTRVNGTRLEPNEPVEIRLGDVVLFGTVAARVLDAARLHAMLNK